MKPPPCVVDIGSDSSLTRRLESSSAIFWPRHLENKIPLQSLRYNRTLARADHQVGPTYKVEIESLRTHFEVLGLEASKS